MATSRRLRYEVFRRDNFTCRYCGASAPDAKLTIDAVTPEALGGSHKDPANLVTACDNCNGGKTSSSPDASLVADVAQDALRWSRAMQAAAGEMLARASEDLDAHECFAKTWARYGSGPDRQPLPKDLGWRQTVDSLLAAGLPMTMLEECIEIAMGQRKVAAENVFRYMCGVAWRKVGEIQTAARANLAADAEPAPAADPDSEFTVSAETLRAFAVSLLDLLPEAEINKALDYAVETPKFDRLGLDVIDFAFRELVMERDRLQAIPAFRKTCTS